MKEVSVNIVNWNGLGHIEMCLDSVFSQDYDSPVNVIVVDNGSTDGSLELVQNKYPDVHTIRNEDNLGFCKAHNQAISDSKSEYCLLLNYDVTLEDNFLSNMVEAIESKENVGMVSGKLYRGIGAGRRILDSTGIEMPFYFQTPRGELREDTGQYDRGEYIFGPCGAAPLYKREMLEDIKIGNEYFDEDFVNYVEDVDLAWRAQLKGWKCAYTPKAVGYHFRGITRADDEEIRKQYYLIGYRNRYWTMYKNMTGREFRRDFYKLFLKETIFLMTRKPGACSRRVVVRAMVDAFSGRGRMRAKRKAVQGDVRVPGSYMGKFFGYDSLNAFSLTFSLVYGGFKRPVKWIFRRSLGAAHSVKKVGTHRLKNLYGHFKKK